jgi:hypothetical protein
MKRRSDDSNGTKLMSKFTHKIDSIFYGLPKPKEWISFATNDLPLLTSIDDDVQEISVNRCATRIPAFLYGKKPLFGLIWP